MIGLLLATVVQFSFEDLQRALGVRGTFQEKQLQEKLEFDSSLQWSGPRPDNSCDYEKRAITIAGELRGVLSEGDLFLVDDDLRHKDCGNSFYSLTPTDRKILEGQALRYETMAKTYAVDCGR